MIRWLHISDLHICDQADWNNYKKELIIKCKEIGKIDFVVVTGDYHDFEDKNDFQDAANFLKKLIKDLGLDISRDLFMVPGNHDGVTELENRKSFVRVARAYPTDIEADKLLKMFEDYDLFVKSVIPDYPAEQPSAVHVRTWNNRISLIHCNTAIGANGTDKEGQVLDINTLCKLDINEEYPAIILAHNSFFDLHIEQQNRIKDFIRVNNVRAYLCGDRHIGQVEQISYADNQNKQIPCVVSYKASPDAADKYSSFGIILGEWENSEATLKGWTWKSGNGFKPDGSICEKKIDMGAKPIALPSNAVKKSHYQLADKYNGWLQINADLEKRKLSNITESMRDFLIGHPCRWSLAFSGLTVKRAQLNELLDKIKSGGIYALLGAGAEGKSTLLKQACVHLYYEGYTVLYHVNNHGYKLPNDLPDNTILVIDDPDNYDKFANFMNRACSLEIPLVIAARRNEWNLFCASRHLSSEIKRAVTKIDMQNITSKKEAEAFADCVIKYYKKDANRDKLVHIFLRNANDFGFLYAAMLISIYDKSQFEEIAKDIIDNIEKNDNEALKLLACAVLFEHLETSFSSREYDEYLELLKISKRNAKESLELELRHSGNRWETRHPQISNLFYEILFGENAKLKSSEADGILCYVIEALLKRYNQYYNQRKYVFEYILASIELINTSASNEWMLERIIEEFKDDEVKLRKIRKRLNDSMNVKFGELCYAREIYDMEIMRYWAKASYDTSGAGSYEKRNSSLWIYQKACLDVKIPGYGLWLEWAALEAETNGAGSYEEKNSALWIYKRACLEEKVPSYGLWLEWAALETETNGAGSYEEKNSALWIYKRACLEEKVPSYGIWQNWADLESRTNGAGSYEKKYSALWIYKKACLEEKVPSYGVWQNWADLESRTNGAGSYEKENSALWIYRKACSEIEDTSYGIWLGWIRLELEVHGTGSYNQENSALWICREACLETEQTYDSIWQEWLKLEKETNGKGSYETENSALWICKKACLEKKEAAYGVWLHWERLEFEVNGIGDYETENSALWICKEACLEKEILNPGLWQDWAKLELDANGAGDYETENSALWIYRQVCIKKELSYYGLWQNWAKLESDENGAGDYETENSALWIYRKACIEREIVYHGLWLNWATLELEKNGAGDYETENSALWIYRKACIEKSILNYAAWLGWARLELNTNGPGSYETKNSALWIYQEACIYRNILNPIIWSNWANLEAEMNGAGSYKTKNSALWIYQEAFYRGNMTLPKFWLEWGKITEENMTDSEWTVEIIYQYALEKTQRDTNVAMAYADYLMRQGQFTHSREIYRKLFAKKKYRALLNLLIIETVARNIDPDNEFSVPQIIDGLKCISTLRVITSLAVYYYLQKEEILADEYREMSVKSIVTAEKFEALKKEGEEFMAKCKEVYENVSLNE